MRPTAIIHTREDAQLYVEQNREAIALSYRECKLIPDWMRNERTEQLWQAGCFLNAKLRELGATDQEAERICFAHGQRSVFGDTWRWALVYLNEFSAMRAIRDEPGEGLAQAINREVFGG